MKAKFDARGKIRAKKEWDKVATKYGLIPGTERYDRAYDAWRMGNYYTIVHKPGDDAVRDIILPEIYKLCEAGEIRPAKW